MIAQIVAVQPIYYGPTIEDCGYRSCDLCFKFATFDALEDRDRKWFRQFGGADDGIVVCQNCLPRYLEEPLQ